MIELSLWRLRAARRVLRTGGVIAYPTEAVYGLGCNPADPVAVTRLLTLKRRPPNKGFILIAACSDQLAPYVLPWPPTLRARLEATWPGPVTWVVPARAECPHWLTGARDTLAVRITAHPLAAALCRSFGGALISTSANVAGRPPAKTPLAVRRAFGGAVDVVLSGATGKSPRPTPIYDARNGQPLRE